MEKLYNIYYHSTKINKLPVNRQVVEKVFEQRVIRKNVGSELKEIPTKDLRIVKCTVV